MGTIQRWCRARTLGVLVLAAGLLVASAQAQTPGGATSRGKGVIRGVVLDADDKQPLGNARVGVYRINSADSAWAVVAEAATQLDGTFRFEVPTGVYRLISSLQSYSPTIRDDLQVAAESTLDVRLTMIPRPIQIEGVDVMGTEARGSEATALTKQKKAAVVSDAITSEQISKSTDSNAAEALQRVTGLSVVDGRYVFVRGLGERYSSTQVNGASVGSPEPNKRVVPLDVFPTSVLDNVVVQKSYTPDQEAEFAGGVVNLNTKDFIEGRVFSQNVSIGYNSNAIHRSFLSYSGGNTDFLGSDDGTRELPQTIQTLAGDQRVVTGTLGQPGFTPAQIQEMGRSFANVWTPRGQNVSPNYSVAASYASGYRVLGRDLGVLASLTLSNTFSSVTRQSNTFIGSQTELTPKYLYEIEESVQRTLGGGLANLSYRLDGANLLKVRGLYTRNTEDFASESHGPNYDFGSEDVKIDRLDFVERNLLSGVLNGEHRFSGLGNLLLDWQGGYSQGRRDEPDRRENIYEYDPSRDAYVVSARTTTPFSRIFGEMDEYDRSARANLTVPLGFWHEPDARLRTGYAYRNRSRLSSFRRFGFRVGPQASNSIDRTLPPEELLVEENIKPGFFELNELTLENDQYRAKQEIQAGYGMVDLPITSWLRAVGGLRYEDSDIGVESQSPFVTGTAPTVARLENADVMPSIQLTFVVTPTMNVRLGFSDTVSRPEFRELSPFNMENYETGYSEQGNPLLKEARIESYDARWELYPGTREIVALSVFHKSFEDPIESIVLPSSGGYVLSPRNGLWGRLTGGEAELRIGVASVWNSVSTVLPIAQAPTSLDHFAVSANYSRVSSKVAVPIFTDPAGNVVAREGPLGGQSTYAMNLGLFYASKVLDASVLHTAFGRRLYQVGAGQYPNSLPDIYEYPLHGLDLTVGKTFSHNFRVKLSAENVLNDVVEFRQATEITRRYLPGRTFTLALSLQ